jgi:hypothetical protein
MVCSDISSTVNNGDLMQVRELKGIVDAFVKAQ